MRWFDVPSIPLFAITRKPFNPRHRGIAQEAVRCVSFILIYWAAGDGDL